MSTPAEPAAGGNAANDRAKAALRQQTAEAAGVAIQAQAPTKTVAQALSEPAQQEQIKAALPGSMSVERFTRICLTAVRTNRALEQCTLSSLLAATMQSAQLGLEPGVLGQAYLVPFYDRKTNSHLVQFIIGYQGFIDLFYRSGQVTSIVAREVCENDEYVCEFGITDTLRHVKARTERGAPQVYYALARFTNGDHLLHEMNLDEIAERRGRSKASNSGPWQTDEIAMSRKTLIRAMVPYMPKSPLLGDALAADESVPLEIHEHMAQEAAVQDSFIEGTVVDDDEPSDPGPDPDADASTSPEPAAEG
jgi:recombination protein RecT